MGLVNSKKWASSVDWGFGTVNHINSRMYTQSPTTHTALLRTLTAQAWACLARAEAAAAAAAAAVEAPDQQHQQQSAVLAALRALEVLASLPEEGQAARLAELLRGALVRLGRLAGGVASVVATAASSGGGAQQGLRHHARQQPREGKVDDDGVAAAAVVKGVASCIARAARGTWGVRASAPLPSIQTTHHSIDQPIYMHIYIRRHKTRPTPMPLRPLRSFDPSTRPRSGRG